MEYEIKLLIDKIELEYAKLGKAVELIQEAEENTTKSAELLNEYKDISYKTKTALTELQNRLTEVETVVNELRFGHSVNDTKCQNMAKQVNHVVFEQSSAKKQLEKTNNDLIYLLKKQEYIDRAYKANETNYQTVTEMYNGLVKKLEQPSIDFTDHIKNTNRQIHGIQKALKAKSQKLIVIMITVGVVSLILALVALIKAW